MSILLQIAGSPCSGSLLTPNSLQMLHPWRDGIMISWKRRAKLGWEKSLGILKPWLPISTTIVSPLSFSFTCLDCEYRMCMVWLYWQSEALRGWGVAESLRTKTSKSEKWERKRCRELLALLSLKLDAEERSVLGITSLPYIYLFFHASFSLFVPPFRQSVSFSMLSFFSDYPTSPPPRLFIVLPYSLPIHTKYFVWLLCATLTPINLNCVSCDLRRAEM